MNDNICPECGEYACQVYLTILRQSPATMTKAYVCPKGHEWFPRPAPVADPESK